METDRWSSSQERTDRPSKRNHSGLNTDSGNEYKRLKCEDSSFKQLGLEDTLLMRQQRSSHKKSLSLDNTCGSQLLRRLVSPQMPNVSHTMSSSDGERRRNTLEQRARVLDDIIDFAESEGDRGGGGGGGRNRGGDNLNRTDGTNRSKNPSCITGGSSVLMNLLVSGCDVSAGYVCLVKPKRTAKSIASA